MIHKVKQGECLSSISAWYGLSWQTVWNHPENAALKRKRKDPNVLYPRDVLHIPERALREESGTTEARHRFRKKNAPAKLKLQLLLNDEPRGGLSFRLYVDGAPISTGYTDGEGFLEAQVSPAARQAQLYVADGTIEDIYLLKLGELDPIDTESGVRQRLVNLGYPALRDLHEAIRAFQQKTGLSVTGFADAQTQEQLQERHGN